MVDEEAPCGWSGLGRGVDGDGVRGDGLCVSREGGYFDVLGGLSRACDDSWSVESCISIHCGGEVLHLYVPAGVPEKRLASRRLSRYRAVAAVTSAVVGGSEAVISDDVSAKSMTTIEAVAAERPDFESFAAAAGEDVSRAATERVTVPFAAKPGV